MCGGAARQSSAPQRTPRASASAGRLADGGSKRCGAGRREIVGVRSDQRKTHAVSTEQFDSLPVLLARLHLAHVSDYKRQETTIHRFSPNCFGITRVFLVAIRFSYFCKSFVIVYLKWAHSQRRHPIGLVMALMKPRLRHLGFFCIRYTMVSMLGSQKE